LIGSRFDFDRYGLVPRSSPRQADLILTAGTVTMKMAPSLVRLYEQLPEPKYVIAMGACTITGGMFSTDSYSTVRGVDKLIPVDVYLPGCPPKPEAIIDAIVRLRKKVAQENLNQNELLSQRHRYHTTRHSFVSILPFHTGTYLRSETRRVPTRSFQPFTQVPEPGDSSFSSFQESPIPKTISMAISVPSRFSHNKFSFTNSVEVFNPQSRRTSVPSFYLNKKKTAVNKKDILCQQAKSSSSSLLTNSSSNSSYLGGQISLWLANRKLENRSLGYDYQGVEVLQVRPNNLSAVALALYAYGFNYLRCQCAYDVSPGGSLASVCYLTRMVDYADQPKEVCIKVLVSRDDPRVPSLFWLWKSVDFQERESYDMFGIIYEGHPHLRRMLMPENWVGWPLRKDYVTPSFYELSP
jgi:NADH-quinone oxidoreductase B subunit